MLLNYILFYRVNHGLAPGRKRAYMLYKAALKDTTSASAESNEEMDGPSPANTNAPHPYFMALGVLSIQKVTVKSVVMRSVVKYVYTVFDRGQH